MAQHKHVTSTWQQIICLTLGICFLPACDQQSRVKSDPATSVNSVRDNAVAREPTAIQASSLPILDTGESLQAGDPTTEGWETESYSEHAQKQLKLVGRLLTGEQTADKKTLDSLIAADYSSDTLSPPMALVHSDEQFHISRFDESQLEPKPGEGVERGADRFLKVMEPLRHKFQGLESQRFKFKLFRVEVNDRQMKTRQYFHLSGRSNKESREFNATWIVDWILDPDSDLPRIRSIVVDQAEQVTFKTDDRPLFADCTKPLLSLNSSYHDCLLRGIQHWQSRLESPLGVYNFAHHGLAIADVNGDGRDDIYICQTGGLPNHLFVQQPDGTLRDVTAESGVDYLDNTRSALIVDLDNDGDQDMVLALTTGLLFLENDGEGNFQERVRIRSVRQAFSLASADYDQDGLLDVYICVYYGGGSDVAELPFPLPYFDAANGGENFLIHNDGNWKFSDVTEQTGLNDDNRRFSFAAAWEDDDNDGDLDLLVVNDYGPNHLYRNQQGTFSNVAQQAGLVDGAFGMSATFGDFDHNGRLDIYVSNMFSAAGNRITFQPQFKTQMTETIRARYQHLARGNSLFQNLGDGSYRDVSVSSGVTMGRWSWGSLFVDINNDSWEDLLVGNGFITGQSTDDL